MQLPTLIAWLAAAAPIQAPAQVAPAAEVEVALVEVVDGDTLDVLLDGEVVALRLLSVDTEEKIAGRASGSATKPETVFGEETAQWARAFFAALEPPGRIGLAFPEGRRLDPYDRLLCHVILPDGRDYNLLLVELGKSPYFNKYGNSLVAHEAFARAQAAARAARRGIWDPRTNRATTPGAPSAVRPYAELLPWWDARAAAIDGFRARAARESGTLVSHEDAPGLARACERSSRDPELRVTVFATIERFFDERDGSLTLLLRSGGPRASLRASIPAAERAAVEPSLRASTAEFRQNYVYLTGRLERETRGFRLRVARAAECALAEPAYPPPAAR